MNPSLVHFDRTIVNDGHPEDSSDKKGLFGGSCPGENASDQYVGRE